MGLEIINYNGQQVMYVNYTACNDQKEMLALLHEAAIFYDQYPSDKIKILSDFTNAYVGLEFMNQLKQYDKELGTKTDRAAVIGVDGLKEILLKGYNMVAKKPTLPFRNKIQALTYLTSVR